MLRTDAGHKPEHMVIGATLTTLSFLCVSVMSALGKVAGQLTSTGVVVLFQNLICPPVHRPDRTPRRLRIAATREDRFAYPAGRKRNGVLVRPVRRNHDDAVDQRDPAELQRSVV